MKLSAGETDAAKPWAPPFISRVRLRNYKSIAECDVRLGPLTILVGPNGSGKSNFLDALAFIARALETTPNEAISERGGIAEIVCRVPTSSGEFGIAIDVTLPWGARQETTAFASYDFTIRQAADRGPSSFEIVREFCRLRRDGQVWQFGADRGVVRDMTRGPELAKVPPDRLYLTFAGTQIFFEPLFRRLQEMHLYNFSPETLRDSWQRAPQGVLGHRGEYLADIIGVLEEEGSGTKERVDAYLRAIVPGVASIDRWFGSLGEGRSFMTLMLRALTGVGGREVVFAPHGISDGTIRAAAVLASLFQPGTRDGRINLVGIEEPESALHPAAAGVLFDALSEASEHVQVIATSQSADLLDREDLDVSVVRPVTMRDGLTIIGEVDEASRDIAQKQLYTLGELMRGNQLVPEIPRADDVAAEET